MNLLQNLLDAFQLIPGYQRLAKLLQVQRRMELSGNRTYLVTRQNVIENFVLFKALYQPRKQLRAEGAQRLRLAPWVEKPARVLRIIQKIA